MTDLLHEQISAAMRYRRNLEAGSAEFAVQCAECDGRAREVVVSFVSDLPWIRRMLSLDVQAAFDGDPAAQHTDEIVFSYPGLRALTAHRIAHELYNRDVPLIPRIMSEHSHAQTGIDIHPGAKIGQSFFIDHGTGVVIGETTRIGDHCKIYQGVTLGAKSFEKDERGRLRRGAKRHPTLEDHVTVYAGATILGGDTVIGAGSIINGGVFLTQSVPPGHVVRGPKADITLRGNTKFHDGKPATAQDVKFTFDFINKHRFPALSRIYETVESAEITGDLTVRLKLRTASAPFTANVLGYAFLAPKHIWEAVPSNLATPADWPNDKPIGSGPWKYVEWRKGEYLQLAANQDFFMKPKLEGMVVLPVPQMESMVGMLERGDSDMLGWNLDMTLGERISRNPELEVVRTPTHGQHEVRLNLGMAPTSNKAFRRALQHVTDRKKLLDIIFSGAGVASNGAPITPALENWANPAISAPEVSVDKARAVLRDAGFTWNAQGRLVMPSA